MAAGRLYLHLLGLFRLLQNDQPVAGFDQARLQHLLAYLVLHRAAPISRQQPPLPDVAELIPDRLEDLDLAPVLAGLEASYE